MTTMREVHGIRVVSTSEGPALVFPPGTASVTAAALLRVLAMPSVPVGSPVARTLAVVQRLLLDLERAPQSSVAGTGEMSTADDLVDVQMASRVLGLTPRAVTKRCCSGAVPGAVKIAGRWLIPAAVLPEETDDDDAA